MSALGVKRALIVNIVTSKTAPQGPIKRAIAATKSFLDLGQRAEKTNRDALAAREVIVAAIYPFADYQRTSATSAFGTKQTSR